MNRESLALYNRNRRSRSNEDNANRYVSEMKLTKPSPKTSDSNQRYTERLINESWKSQFANPVLNLDLKLREVWCRYILYTTFCQGLHQYRLKKGIPINQGNCQCANQIVANYFATNPEIDIQMESSISMLAERLTADILQNSTFGCNQCIPKWLPYGLFKINGSVVVRHSGGISIDNMNLISQTIYQQPLLNLLQIQRKNTLIQKFFEVKRDLIPDYSCFCYIQPDIVSLARYWYLQKNILSNVDIKNDIKKLNEAKILTVTNTRGIVYQIEQFSKYVETLKNRSTLKDILTVFYLLSGGKINEAKKIARLIAKIIYHGCFANEDNAIKIVVTNQPEIIKKFLATIFMFGISCKGINGMELGHRIKPRNITLNNTNIPIVSVRENGSFYHLTYYSVGQLQNLDKLPDFHQDALCGHLVNIIDLNGIFEENSYLDKVSKGKAVAYKHPIFGKSEFNPIGSYVFITDKISDKYFGDVITKDDYEVYDLTDVTPCKNFDFDIVETTIFVTYISAWGYRVSEDKGQDDWKLDPVKLFFEKCVERKEITYKTGKDGKSRPEINEETATSFRTVNAAYTRFCNFFPVKSKILFNTAKVEENGFLVKKDKKNQIRERDLKRGFLDEEVLAVDSNTDYVAGCLVKSPHEIEDIARQVISEWNNKEIKLSPEDFFVTMEKEILG